MFKSFNKAFLHLVQLPDPLVQTTLRIYDGHVLKLVINEDFEVLKAQMAYFERLEET